MDRIEISPSSFHIPIERRLIEESAN